MNAAKKMAARLGLMLLALACLAPASAQADFGIKSFSASALNQDGSIDRRAASHPFEYIVKFGINLHNDAFETPEGRLRTIVVDLPPGMVGNPMATPPCPRADFDGASPRCSASTQVGLARVAFLVNGLEGQVAEFPVYNLTPGLGRPATLGFNIDNIDTFQDASIRTGDDYGVSITDAAIPAELEFQSVVVTIWGMPMDSAHTPDRFCGKGELKGCASEAFPAPFLTLPTSCGAPLKTTLHLESLENPGFFVSKTVLSEDDDGIPAGLVNCEASDFSPTITVRPETEAAESPTGIHVNVHIPQNEDPNPEAVATAHLKSTVVSLPPGLAVNPSAADGMGACSLDQVGLKKPSPAQCPENSKVGTVQVSTPLLDHPLPGAVYLAKQGENPFGSLIALYIAVNDPFTGVVVKLAGKVEPDPTTGQLRTTFEENPQLPFEDFNLDFFGGARAALTTPATCGSYTTTSRLTPWTAPEGSDAFPTDSFRITAGAKGGSCPSSEGQMPNAPRLEAGTSAPLAGSYSPFVLKLDRENGMQRLRALNVTLPPGVTGKLAGLKECSELQIAAAAARANLGEGSLEKARPSCPANSEVGIVNVGAGSGSPFYVQGHAYLAGPYKGAPLSLVIITPAVAGPFDLGTVVVRSALYVDESTARITAKSDPIPTILHGVPLAVRSVAVKLERPEFTLNPTSCEPMTIGAEAISPLPSASLLTQRFQVGGCRGLGFSPALSLKLSGGTGRTKHPALRGELRPVAGDANIARFSFALPASEFIDQFHISNPCTRPQFATGNCPPRSVLGKVRVFTPLLDKPLEGQVYFRSNGGERALPDVVVDLRGQIHLISVGFVDAVHRKGSEKSRVRTTFATVPDAPVSKIVFRLKGGKKKGLLVNSQNLCAKTTDRRADVKMTAHNGALHNLSPLVANSCGRKKK